MATVVVEDGSGKSNADSYISEADAATFLATRGDTVFNALTATQQGYLLRKATDYMVQMYRQRWRGTRVIITQALDWPRNFVYLDDFGNTEGRYGYGAAGYIVLNNVVPLEIQHACAMLALIANGGDLAPNLSQVVKSSKIDVIETVYDNSSPPWKVYRAVLALLAPYFSELSSGPSAQIVRT